MKCSSFKIKVLLRSFQFSFSINNLVQERIKFFDFVKLVQWTVAELRGKTSVEITKHVTSSTQRLRKKWSSRDVFHVYHIAFDLLEVHLNEGHREFSLFGVDVQVSLKAK